MSASVKRNEGWAQPIGGVKEHFFRDGRSLCRKWGFFGTTQPNPPDEQYTCTKCERLAAPAKSKHSGSAS